MKLLFAALVCMVLSAAKTPPNCIEMSNYIGTNCESDPCFQIKANCPFDRYDLTIFDRWAAIKTKYQSTSLDEVVTFCNNLQADTTFKSGTYYFLLNAINKTDTTVAKQVVELYKK